ncbi:MAG: hypothetical protein KDD37_02995 [Bdellovibrionales bacterium]|nr:hypothetical protein [Bdellovibrionales bacterium]
MTKKLEIAEKMDSFFSKIVSIGLDFHIAAITTNTDDPAHLGNIIGSPSVLDRETWDLQTAFSQLIQPSPISAEANKSFDALTRALSFEKLSKENKNFLREEALLVIIVVSDKADESLTASVEVQEVLDRMKPAGSKQGWILHSIVPDIEGCGKSIANHTILLSQITEGASPSYCDPTEMALREIRDLSLRVATELPLSLSIDHTKIEVSVNDTLVPKSSINGWDYYEKNHSIRFYGSAIPATDTIIKIIEPIR